MRSSEDHPAPRQDTAELPVVDEVDRQIVARTGWSRRSIIAAVAAFVALLAVLAADAAITRSAERAAAERVGAALDTPVEVRLRGWPVGYRLLTRRPVDARVIAVDVPVPGTAATLQRLELELEEVTVVGDGFTDPDAVVVAPRGRFAADLDDDTVQELIGIVGRLPLVDLELQRGVARLVVAGFPVIDASAEVVDGRVVFEPTAPIGSLVQVRVQLELSELPYGFRPDDVEIRRGTLRLTGSADDLRFAPE